MIIHTHGSHTTELHAHTSRAQAVWKDETLEFNGLRADPRTPAPLQAHLASFQLPSGSLCHAFNGDGLALSTFPWEEQQLDDEQRVQLLSQLLETVNYLHGRGSAHLGLDGEVVRVTGSDAPANQPAAAADGGGGGGGGRSSAALTLIGLGAAVRLQSAPQRMDESRRDTYQMSNGVSFAPYGEGIP